MRRWGTRLIQSLETQFVIEQLASLSACQSSFKTSMGIRQHGKCKFDPKNKVSVCVCLQVTLRRFSRVSDEVYLGLFGQVSKDQALHAMLFA